MARKVFFSFKYDDVGRAMIVRNSDTIRGAQKSGFIDKADFEQVEREGPNAIRDWIDQQLSGTTVTVVLVGAHTHLSGWVRYEIAQSIRQGNGLLGVDVSQINAYGRGTSTCGSQLPVGYPFYRWNRDKGYENLGTWVEAAARLAGK